MDIKSKINGRIGKRERTNQICHLNESFKPGIVLDVNSVKVNAMGPRMRNRLEKVLDLVIVDINSQDLVGRMGHKLLVEMRTDEYTGADHVNSDGLDGVSVQI